MKIKILHLYHDLMNLYGDWANAEALARELAARGRQAEIEKKSVGDDVDFGACDFVYIGSGTERSQRACMRDISRHKGALLERIGSGLHVLATGNAHELFGMAVTQADGERYGTMGLLDFETIQRPTRVSGDCVCKAAFLPDRLIGFINRAGHGQEGEIERPFTAELGPGSNDKTKTEGIKHKNLLGTYMTGPLLVRNPPLLKHFADALCLGAPAGAQAREDPFFGYQEAAYHQALIELMRRC